MEICESNLCGVISCAVWMSYLVHTVGTSRDSIYHRVLILNLKARVHILLQVKVSKTGCYIIAKTCLIVGKVCLFLGRTERVSDGGKNMKN